MILEIIQNKTRHYIEDFFITEHQTHALEVEKWIVCQGQATTHEESSRLPKIWKDKDCVKILNQHWAKKYNNYGRSKGYKASEIAQNLGVSLRELKKWTQQLELREYIYNTNKKVGFYCLSCQVF